MGFIQDYTKSNLKASNCIMRKILFETHHLYYLPNFFPIVDEFRKRGNSSSDLHRNEGKENRIKADFKDPNYSWRESKKNQN